jgi:hypothetical protein
MRLQVAVILVLIGTLAGCGPRSTPTPVALPTPTPAPADVAQLAARRMQAVRSLHFVMELAGKPVPLDSEGSMLLQVAEGDLVRPDQVRALVKVVAWGMTSEIGIVAIGRDRFATNPMNQKWEKLPPDQGWFFDAGLIFDSEVGLESILLNSEWSFGPQQTIEGQVHAALHGTVPAERIAPLASGLITAGPVEVDVWVSLEDGSVRRIQMVELESEPLDPTQWLLTFSAFDELKGIKPPPVD